MTTKIENTKEKKTLSVPFECKALPDQSTEDYFYFEGYLSTYGNTDFGDDIMVKGCFDESLKELKPDLLFQHDGRAVIGIFEEIESDNKGLRVVGKLPKADTLVSGRVIPQMTVGSVRSMSIGFWTQVSEYDEETNIRRITKCMLIEGSIVSQPMNPKAAITDFKSFEIDDVKDVKTKREFENILRDSGAFSRKSAAYLSSRFIEDEPSDSVESDDELKTLLGGIKELTKTSKGILNVN